MALKFKFSSSVSPIIHVNRTFTKYSYSAKQLSLFGNRPTLSVSKELFLYRGISSGPKAGLSSDLKDPSLFRNTCFINNKWVDITSSQSTFEVEDPASEETIATCPDAGTKEANEAIDSAHKAFYSDEWSKLTAKDRHDLLMKLYHLFGEHKSDLANIVTRENGKPYAEALGEVQYSSGFLEWFAEEAQRSYGDMIPSPDPSARYMVIRQPVGVVGIITPWNFPLAMITRKMGAALAAGCTVVIKPASETPLAALAIAELVHRAGFPPGVINIITSSNNTKDIGNTFCTNPLVSKISFTGSTNIGKVLMSASSGTLKKMSLELGGNAPFIVFDDADLDSAVDGFVKAKFRNSGQTCVCPNRLYVHSSIHSRFTDKLVERVNKLKVGPGLDEGVTVGPMISAQAREKVSKHVEDAISKGASVRLGGEPVVMSNKKGFFYAPTVITGMKPNMLATQEETFGPVASVYSFENEKEVIQLANDTNVGLAGYLYTKDLSRAFKVSEALQVGMVAINSGSVSTHCAPFGGVKESGLGREGSKYGLMEYTDLKFVSITI